MNLKANKFQEFLTTSQINCFEIQEVQDELNSVIFRSRMDVEGQNLPTVIILDDSIYAVVRIQVVAALVKESNRITVMEFINELNRQFKVFKYYIADNGDIYLDSCVVSTPEQFDVDMVRSVIDVLLKHLGEYYKPLMRKIWID